MQYARCRCGDYEIHTTMGVTRCAWCPKCKTTPAFNPASHSEEQPKHQMIETAVMTDGADGTLTRCLSCMKTLKEIEAKGQPWEMWKGAEHVV